MATKRAIKAWVVRWDWQGERARVEQPVAALLRPQTPAEQVRKIVELLYASSQHTPDEMLDLLRPKAHRPYPAQFGAVTVTHADGRKHPVPWTGEIFCGHNPFLIARLARAWARQDGSGGIDWQDDPRPEPVLE